MKTNFYYRKAENPKHLTAVPTKQCKFFAPLFFLLACFFSSFSQTTPLSFTQIPLTDADLIAPGRGAEHWNNVPWDGSSAPQIPSGNASGLNTYRRFNWSDMEGASQDSYTWSQFDAAINGAIDNGRSFSFGIMSLCSSCGAGGDYPAYLHNLMQAEAPNSQDWNYGGTWIPNWNSPNYLGRWQALLNAVAAHIASGSHNGKNYKDVIYYIDVRGYGDFGEWHTYPWTGTEPPGRAATAASLMKIIDAHKTAFPDYPLMIPMAAFDGGNASQIPAQASYYALTTSNKWGQIGWRRDNYGDAGYNDILVNNPYSYNPGSGSIAFAPLIMNKWRFAPVGGEPANDAAAISRNCGTPHCDLENEIRTFHAVFGNGNYPISATDGNLRANVVAASKASGYRLILSGGTMTTTLTPGLSFNVTLNWQNIGIAPTYENWNAVYELRNGSGTVVWTGTSAFTAKLFLPLPGATPVPDVFTLPAGVAAGTYDLFLLVKDPTGYKSPLPLAITGRNTDGSYLIRGNITVGAGSGNQPPTANAGSDKIIQLPANSTSLSGSGADPDGTIASYAWTKISGPAGGTITTASLAISTITGLIQGLYTYKLTVTDNLGATGSASVKVTVNPAGGTTFVVNAGPDQNLPAGTTATTLSGTFPPSSSPSDTVNLIVIQGESNAAGIAPNSSALSAELGVRSGVQILNHTTLQFENLKIGGTAQNNNDPDGYPTDPNNQHGFELGLANAVDASRLPNPTYLVKIGASGSYIAQWLPGSSRGLWEIFIPYVDAAVAKLNAAGKKYRIIVWQSIGLNDRYSVFTNPVNFTTMMAQFRTDFRARFGANIRFLSTNFNNPPSQTFDWTTLWDQMAAADPLFHSIPVTGADYIDGSTHWAYAGMKLIAKNMVDTMLATVPGASGGSSSYASTWSKVSGSAGGIIQSPNTAATPVTAMTAGTDTFRLSVTDNLGVTVTSDMHVTIAPGPPPGQMPVANAGVNTAITLPVNATTLNGSASHAAGTNTLTTYAWSKMSGPAPFTIANPGGVTTALTNLIQGSYKFKLLVTDNLGATGTDSVIITVNPAVSVPPPVANAGANTSITLPVNSTTLNGSASHASGSNTITSYAWSKMSGPASFTIANPGAATTGLANLVQGSYKFRLLVTDNLGATATDSVIVTVNPAFSVPPPVAIAGGNSSITLPVNSTTLNGSASHASGTNTLTSYAWSKISGPAQYTIANPGAASTALNNLVQGTYKFKLVVTDNQGATGTDSATITVLAANPPTSKGIVTANAGTDITISFPTAVTTLNGSASSSTNGAITSFTWRQIQGPAAATIKSAANVITSIEQLLVGDYLFELTIKDIANATAKDTVKVTVVNSLRYTGSIKVYPNPTFQNHVTLDALNDYMGKVIITLMDANGNVLQQKVFDKQTTSFRQRIDFARTASGVYFLNVQFNGMDKPYIYKLIKN